MLERTHIVYINGRIYLHLFGYKKKVSKPSKIRENIIIYECFSTISYGLHHRINIISNEKDVYTSRMYIKNLKIGKLLSRRLLHIRDIII